MGADISLVLMVDSNISLIGQVPGGALVDAIGRKADAWRLFDIDD